MEADEEMIQGMQSIDSAAFDSLVDRYYGSCLRLAWWHPGQHEDATWPHGELYQEAHEVGTPTMTYGDTQTHTCEDDFVTIS